MKKQLMQVLVGIVCLYLTLTSNAQQKVDSLIQALGNQYTTHPGMNGLSIGIRYKEKEKTYHFGTIQKGMVKLPGDETLFEIGSIAKTFSGYLLAKAILEKKIRLDDDIRNYLDGDYPNLVYEGKPILILHLANSTSGLPDWLPLTPAIIKNASPDSAGFLREKIYNQYTREDFYAALKEIKLDTIPGTIRQHSNAAAELLTYILEKVYKLPYEKIVEQNILQPLKMEHTFYSAYPSQERSLAKGYNENGNEMPYMKKGWSSTIIDMLKYITFLQGKDKAAVITLRRTINVDVTNDHVTIKKSGVYTVALNWFSYQYDDGISQTWYDGSTHGFCSYIIFYPALELNIVVMANTSDKFTFGQLQNIAYQVFQVMKKNRN